MQCMCVRTTLPVLVAVTSGGAGGSGCGGAPAGGEVPVPDDLPECPICVDAMDGPVVTPCSHWFCREVGLCACVQGLRSV